MNWRFYDTVWAMLLGDRLYDRHKLNVYFKLRDSPFSFKTSASKCTKPGVWRKSSSHDTHICGKTLSHSRAYARMGQRLSLQRWRTVSSPSQLTVYVFLFSHTDESGGEGFRAAGFVVSVLPQAIIFNSTNSVRNSWWCSSLNTDLKSIHPPNR